ncbi:Remodeling and spacing factor 1 [Geodia barretti]|uniref:Remodeling and spacing factor 1 n=1 Tax=Geodia barretti TaxID=519541 RepID=A0AA35WGA4_GEOBA|nr:Remodeling and spacing factor 1 [Geodia barretti]
MSAVQNGPKQGDLVSPLPDYAQVFMFLRQFGELLAFPPVSLSELEDFFLTRHHDEEDKVVGIHWRLLMSVTRRENRRDWKKMATRFAVRSGVITQGLPYSDIPVEKRIHIMKLACEAQFDCNLPFKAELKKLELASDKPIGVDRFGHRYWLLQDSFHDVRLYRESEYDVMPPEGSSWALLARSINELDVRIANLVAKNEVSPDDKVSGEEEEEEEMEVNVTETDKCFMSQSQRMSRQTRVTSRAKKEGKKGSKKPPKAAGRNRRLFCLQS